jgi:hypothetical protein
MQDDVDEKFKESMELGGQVAGTLLKSFREAIRLVVDRASDPSVAISALGAVTAWCFAIAVAYILTRSTMDPSRYPEHTETIARCLADNFKDKVNEILLGSGEGSVVH